MSKFEEYLKSMGLTFCSSNSKYSKAGKTFCLNDASAEGIYWFYEADDFIIDIHNFFVKKERLIEYSAELKGCLFLSSSYVVAANGESFNPYQPLTSNMMFLTNLSDSNCRFILHANCPYLSVGINFRESMFQKYLSCHKELSGINATKIFFESREQIVKPMSKVAFSILNCNMTSPAAEIFFEAKAKEWLSITVDAFINKMYAKPLSQPDDMAIESVANYINDHYAINISQKLLENISMMSGTKLKNCFRQKYHMSITEYTQRKRMNMAETLLLTTTLDIGDIAKAVGYVSHSKFTACFRKYKGIYPKDVRKMSIEPPICDCHGKSEA